MTPEQKRIAIAEACGWIWRDAKEGTAAHWFNQNTKEWTEELPDYLNDLNAMHEAEKVLTADQWYKYDSLMPLRDPQKIHATAAQRAEAFLRTLNLWK